MPLPVQLGCFFCNFSMLCATSNNASNMSSLDSAFLATAMIAWMYFELVPQITGRDAGTFVIASEFL